MEVRRSGFTVDHQDYQEAVEAYNHDVVEIRRLEEKQRLQLLGPTAGGSFGSRPLVRLPFPLSSIVSAVDAKAMIQTRQGTVGLLDSPQKERNSLDTRGTSRGSLLASKPSSPDRGLSPERAHFEGLDVPITTWGAEMQAPVPNQGRKGRANRPTGIVV